MTGHIPVLAAPLFDPGAGRVELTMPEGLTLALIVRMALPQASNDNLRRCRVTLVSETGSSTIGHALWHAVRPKPGVRVVIRLIPGKGALRSILMVAVSIAAVALGQYWALGMGFTAGTTGFAIASSLITMGVNMVGSLLINALVPPVMRLGGSRWLMLSFHLVRYWALSKCLPLKSRLRRPVLASVRRGLITPGRHGGAPMQRVSGRPGPSSHCAPILLTL